MFLLYQVTYISGYDSKYHENLTKIKVDDHYDEIYGNILEKSTVSLIYGMATKSSNACLHDLGRNDVQTALKNTKFDMAILYTIFSDCFLSVIHENQVI